MNDEASDYKKIQTLIYQQFESLQWTDTTQANWPLFESGFNECATLFPAKRPVAPITPKQFQQRMSNLKTKNILFSFNEKVTACDIRIYGNIATAIVGCEMQENNSTYTHDVNIMILLKNENQWRIVSQAWDAVPVQVCLSLN